MSANLLQVIQIANDLLMTYQAVQGIANGAVVSGRPVTDEDVANARMLAKQAGIRLDQAIAEAKRR